MIDKTTDYCDAYALLRMARTLISSENRWWKWENVEADRLLWRAQRRLIRELIKEIEEG